MKKNLLYEEFKHNGVKVYLVKRVELESVSVSFVLKSGKKDEAGYVPGTVNLLFKTINKGTQKRDSFEIADFLDSLGSSIDFSVSNDYSLISLWSIKEHFEKSFGMFNEIITQPVFPEEEIKNEKLRFLTELKKIEDDPSALSSFYFEKIVFKGHPYGEKPEPEKIINIGRDEILSLYEKIFSYENFFLVFSGKITKKEVKSILDKFPFNFKRRKEESLRQFKIDFKEKTIHFIHKASQNQFQVRIGYPLEELVLEDKTHIVSKVFNYPFGGGGFSTRLMKKVRAKKGLTYGIFSNFSLFSDASYFVVRSFTRKEGLHKLIDIVLEEMVKVKRKGLSLREINFSKEYYRGKFPLQIETPYQIATTLMLVELYGLRKDLLSSYIDLVSSIKKKDIDSFSEKFIMPDRVSVVIVGPEIDREKLPGDFNFYKVN